MKEEILKTALNQFVNHGIRDMSVQKLASALAISTKTFYKHFENKEVLIEEVIRLHYEQQYKQLEKLVQEKNPVVLFYEIWQQATLHEYSVSNKFFSDLNYYYPALQLKIEREIGEKFWVRLKQIIDNGIEKGVFRKNINPFVILESISVLLDRIGRSDQFQKLNVMADEIFENSIAVIIKGFCTPKGLETLDNYISNSDNSDKI
ncbi:MAG TPA: TetR/AcrR family transcriptional regulator [Draconibacterium sp.]|nr:TetR/AcrR family transcriptional regulator [Draconibacterium sp.]